MTTYRCWIEDDRDECDAPEYSERVFDEESAAKRHAEYLCGRDTDYYSTFEGGQDVLVRNLDTNKLYTVPVSMRAEPMFFCARKTEKKDG